MWTIVYNILLSVAALFLVPYYLLKILVTGKYRKSIGPKFGFIPSGVTDAMKGRPRIWMHAVSVGEVTAAAPVISSLREELPDACIVLSTSTETGQEMARGMVADATAIFYYPLDIPLVVRRVMDRVKPDIFVPVETEVWPNFIRLCRKRGIRVAMVNGRISPRSFRKYRLTRFFWKDIFNMIDKIGAISPIDEVRLKHLGVYASKVHLMGNAKYDGLAAKSSPLLRDEIGAVLNIAAGSRVLVAGSTHGGEEEVVLDVYRRLRDSYPDLLLVLVPRHIERTEEIQTLIRSKGFAPAITMTEIREGRKRGSEPIIVIDVIGELFKVYSLATVIFCGGSLVPKGGQNILEAAAWGKVVLYGPSMEDFSQEKEALERVGAGITVANTDAFLREVDMLMADPDILRDRGEAGRRMVHANMGASRRYAGMVMSLLGK